jgi:hypothetical protein
MMVMANSAAPNQSHWERALLGFGHVRSVQYVAPTFPNHPQNKRETENRKQNGKDIEDHSKPRRNILVSDYFCVSTVGRAATTEPVNPRLAKASVKHKKSTRRKVFKRRPLIQRLICRLISLGDIVSDSEWKKPEWKKPLP